MTISRFLTHRVLLAACSLCVATATLPAQFSGPALSAQHGVNFADQVTTDPAILFPADRDIVLQPGDSVRISIYGVSDYATPDRVASDGSVRLPLVGTVQVQGLPRHQAEALIARQLAEAGMFNNPQVVVDVLETPTQTATVIGEVHGVVPVLGRRRLFDVLAVAGGLTPVTSHTITIHRPGVLQAIVVDLGTDAAHSEMSNVPIFAGDTIETARVGSVFMLGAFRTQQAIPLGGNTPLTLMQAMTIVGGLPWDAKADEMRIIRTAGTHRTAIPVDVKKVIAGKAPDPVLQTDDIVLLPTNNLRAVLRNGSVNTAVGIAVAARALYY